MSTGRDEGGNLRALEEMIEHVANLRALQAGWLPWSELRQLLRTVDLVFPGQLHRDLQRRGADAIAEGVPAVASDAIDRVPRWWQARADEPLDVARVAERLLRDPDAPRHRREVLRA
jgi:hypothetical protein